MEITKIFIAAQPDNLKTDISEVEIFIHRINNCYVSRGHFFTTILGESLGDATCDAEIADCSLAFFLAELGSELPDNYKTAINSYNKTGKPKISVYIKNTGDEKPSPPSTIDYSIITTNYTHLDTLKLEILMQIKQFNLDGVDIHLEDGKAWQGNTVLLSLENVEAVSGYENLQNLKQKRADLESRYIEAKARYAETPDDPETYEAYTQASGQRNEAIGEIRNIEEQLYNLMEGMYIQTAKGKLSKRQEEAYRLAERGLLSEARDTLDYYAIVSDSRHEDESAEQIAARVQVHVNELLQLKDLNAALLDWEGVDECYKEAARLEEKHGLPRNASVLYVEHLYYQNRHDEAIEIGERIRSHYETPHSGVPDEEKSLLYNFLGVIYYESNHMADSEKMLKASLEIRLRREDGSLEWREREIAVSYNGLGNLYYLQNRFAEAEEAHKKALEIRKKWTEIDPDAVELSLAWTYVNLGALYNEDDNKTNEAIELMSAARDIFKKLAVSKPEPNEGYLAHCYANLGISYAKLQCFDESEDQFNNALQLQIKLAGDNPNAYESKVAETYSDFGNALFKAGMYSEAIDKHSAALGLFKKLSARSPDAFEPSTAQSYANLAEAFIETNRFSEAETALKMAIKLFDKHTGTNPAYSVRAADARKTLRDLNVKQLRAAGAYTELTPQEQETAKLLTEGLTQREIARKLNINAEEYEQREKAIKHKLDLMSDPDPVIAEIITQYKLTKRESDVLKYLRDDVPTETIADELFISEGTVRVHVTNILRKLNIEKRQNIAAWINTYEIHPA